jgi:signal transduction histidine kinase
MALPRSVKIYAASMAVLGGLSVLPWLGRWSPMPSHDVRLLAIAILGNAVAMLFPLPIAPGRKVHLAVVVQVAALLLFPPAPALLALGLSTLAANLILRARGKRDIWNVLFNSGQHTLSLALAWGVLATLTPPAAPAFLVLDNGRSIVALGLAVSLLYLVNTWAVALAVALQRRQAPLAVWRAGRGFDILHNLALYPLGVVAAVTIQRFPWMVLLLILPMVLIYQALRRMLELTDQATRSAEALRALSQRLRTAQEAERKRLSLTLHDGPLQRLHHLLRLLEAGAPVEESLAVARQATTELRATTTALHPPALDDLGLPCALASLVHRAEGWAGCPAELDADGYALGRLTPDAELALYRIAQEALANCAKHAGASAITVTLRQEAQDVVLEVRDNGQGFATEPNGGDVAAQEHLGLLEMRECAQAFGGFLSITSVLGQGAVVRAGFPAASPAEGAGERWPEAGPRPRIGRRQRRPAVQRAAAH